MLKAIVALATLTAIVACSGEGNIRLLQDEVAAAIKVCSQNNIKQGPVSSKERERRSNRNATDGQNSNQYPRMYNSSKDPNLYSHQRRNTSDMMIQNISNIMNNYLFDQENLYGKEHSNNTPRSYSNHFSSNDSTFSDREKRSKQLMNHETDQCLSQCVFANLHVVDSRGIPREADLWNKVQSTVKSQQSRATFQHEIRACFQELQSEDEDNGCSYSNKLEQCLMLGFTDRMKQIKSYQN